MHSLHHENYKSMTKNDKGSPRLEIFPMDA